MPFFMIVLPRHSEYERHFISLDYYFTLKYKEMLNFGLMEIKIMLLIKGFE